MKTRTLFFAVLFLGVFVASRASGADQAIVAGDVNSNSMSAEHQGNTLALKLRVIAVFDSDPQLPGTQCLDDAHRKGKKVWVLNYADNPKAFQGAIMYAFGTQNDWPKNSTGLNNMKFQSALGQGAVESEFVKINLANRYPDESRYYQPIIWVVCFPNGVTAWGGHPDYPNGSYVVRNKNGAPQTWILVNNQDKLVAPPGKMGRELAQTRK